MRIYFMEKGSKEEMREYLGKKLPWDVEVQDE